MKSVNGKDQKTSADLNGMISKSIYMDHRKCSSCSLHTLKLSMWLPDETTAFVFLMRSPPKKKSVAHFVINLHWRCNTSSTASMYGPCAPYGPHKNLSSLNKEASQRKHTHTHTHSHSLNKDNSKAHQTLLTKRLFFFLVLRVCFFPCIIDRAIQIIINSTTFGLHELAHYRCVPTTTRKSPT